jgi:hypothetical protein
MFLRSITFLPVKGIAGVSFLCIIMVACNQMAITYDYDKKANFKKYRTYAFSENLNNLSIKTFDKMRILRAIDNEMGFRGYETYYTTQGDTMDLLIDVQTMKSISPRTSAANTRSKKFRALGGYELSANFTTSDIDLRKYKDDALFINIIENSQRKIIWQGRCTKAIDYSLPSSERELNINYAVTKTFRYYPVRSSR